MRRKRGLLIFVAGVLLVVFSVQAAGRRGRAPAFRALGLDRRPIWVSPGTATPTLLLFFCDCDDCHRAARRLAASGYPWGQGVALVGVIHSSPQIAQQFQQETGFPGFLLVDPDGEAKAQYGVRACPSLWVVRPGGRLQARRDHVSWPELDRQVVSCFAAGSP